MRCALIGVTSFSKIEKEMSSFDPSTHKLAGSNLSEAGGLILKNSKQKTSSDPKDSTAFKKPSASLLGLDRLARRKREERDAEGQNFPEKKARLHTRREGDQDDPDVRISFGKVPSKESVKDRKYRGALVETPSYTGGVSEEALQKVHSRLVGREQSHGVYASTTKRREGDRDRRRDDR